MPRKVCLKKKNVEENNEFFQVPTGMIASSSRCLEVVKIESEENEGMEENEGFLEKVEPKIEFYQEELEVGEVKLGIENGVKMELEDEKNIYKEEI